MALAGYTNSGKSTLLNAFTGAHALVADQPFATLDPTTRRLKLPDGRTVVLSDTVGFVRKLPHDLVDAFTSTLEEVTRAELVVHVADASALDVGGQIRAVREVLHQIGAGGIPEVVALNKWDAISEVERARLRRSLPDALPISARLGEGLDALAEAMARTMPREWVEVDLLIPFDRPELLPLLYREGRVERTESGEQGTGGLGVRARSALGERGAVRATAGEDPGQALSSAMPAGAVRSLS